MKKALITGITGQDGSYLAELLLGKGYEVHGIIRRASTFNTGRIGHLFQDPHEKNKRLTLHYGDLSDSSNISRLIEKIQPDEIYHLGAQSHVRVSFDIPEYTADIGGLGTLRILDAIRETRIKTKFYQASSSEMFGKTSEVPQNEQTPFHPRSPYGCAKVFGYWITANYRESYGLYACNGILFNHESPRRGETFVTRKITRGLSRIKLGLDEKLYLGNLEAKRDWGYAKDYVEGMWLMLQQPEPGDYVLATGETHTVRELVETAARELGINITWVGSGLDEKGIDSITGKVIIEIDPAYFRPAEVDLLVGDAAKARRLLGWQPTVKFHELIKLMVKADYEHESKRAPLNKSISLVKSSFYNEPAIKKELAEFVLKSDKFSMGPKCAQFEKEFSQKQQRPHSVFVNSGSSANLVLIQSLLNMGLLKKGDRVGFSGLTWATNVMPLIQLGLVPVPVDCELASLNISPAKLAPVIDSLQALFITNTLGLADDLPAIAELCRFKNILLLEDNCEGLGSKIGEKLLGNFGLASTFSFFVGHHLSTIEGGMICTSNEELYDMLVMTRAHGWARNLPENKQASLKQIHGVDDFYNKYTFYDLAYNVRPAEINGFLGIKQLAFWDEIVEKRQNNFRRFCEAMAFNHHFSHLDVSHMDVVSNFAMPVICASSDAKKYYADKFQKNKIEIRPVVAGDITQQPFYKKYLGETAYCPIADLIHKHGFYFPNNAELTHDEISLLCDLLKL